MPRHPCSRPQSSLLFQLLPILDSTASALTACSAVLPFPGGQGAQGQPVPEQGFLEGSEYEGMAARVPEPDSKGVGLSSACRLASVMCVMEASELVLLGQCALV